MKTDWKRKLTSRKFWAAVADFVGMLLIALKVDEGSTVQITALIMASAGAIAYIIGEGLTDAAAGAGDDRHAPVESVFQILCHLQPSKSLL